MDMLVKSKKAIAQILEICNLKYAGEVKKDPEREIKFLYSKFSPVADCIERKQKTLLKDVITLV